jgi:hypothetical protein
MAGVINTTYTFTATDLVTSTKLNNLIDETIFTSDSVNGTTLEVTGTGKLRVATGGITSNEILDANVITAKIAAGAVVTASLADTAITTAKLTDASVTNAKLATDSVGTVKIINASITSAKMEAIGPSWNSGYTYCGANTAQSSYTLAISGGRTASGSSNLTFGATSGGSLDASITRASGANGNFAITNTGTGTLSIANGSGSTHITFNSFVLAQFSASSVIFAATTYATSFVTTSDYRLKSDVADLGDPLAQVLALRPVSYLMRDERRLGLIAHEMAEIFPEAVRGEKDAVDAEGAPVYQAIEYTALIPVLIAAIQRQQRQIDELMAGK